MKAPHEARSGIRIDGRGCAGSHFACAVALALFLVVTAPAFAAAPTGSEARVVPVLPPAAAEMSEAPAPAPARIDLSGPWKFRGDWEENGLAEGWQQPDLADSDWRSLHVPATWEEQGIITANPRWPSTEPNDGYNGYAWYRRRVIIPANWDQAAVRFRSGQIHDMDWTYVNARLIGSTIADEPWTQSRDYLIPPDVLKAGEDNVIAIRICDMGGAGGMLEGPVELVNVSAVEVEAGEARSALESRYPGRQQELVNIGGGVEVPETVMVDGDAVAIGGPVDVRGYVRGSVVAIGGNIHAYAGSRIDGDAVSIGGSVIREGDAQIGGSVVQGPFLPGGLVSRIVTTAIGQKERRMPEPWPFGRFAFLGRAGSFFSSLLLWAIVTALAVLLFPRRLEVMARALPAHPGASAAYGIAGFVLSPAAVVTLVVAAAMLSVLLCITVIGILAVPAVWAGVLAAIAGVAVVAVLGTSAVFLSLGRAVVAQVGRGDTRALWAVLLGVLLVAVGSALPVIGRLLVVTVAIFGFGLAIMTGVGAEAKWAPRKLRFRRKSEGGADPGSPGEARGTDEPRGADLDSSDSGQREPSPEEPSEE